MSEHEDFEKAMGVAAHAIYGDDGRGMIGQARRHLQQRIAREIMKAARQSETTEAAPIVWMNPEDAKRTMIAGPGERASVAPYKEDGYTMPLYEQPPEQKISVDWSHSFILRKQAEAVIEASNEAHRKLFEQGSLCKESGEAMAAMLDYADRLRTQAAEKGGYNG